jgi:putative ABC transport system substrate-binding protein
MFTDYDCIRRYDLPFAPPLRGWGDFVRSFVLAGIILLCGWLLNTSEAFALEKRLIAVIMANSQPRYHDVHAVFVESLQPVLSSDDLIYVQTPNADFMSLRNSVRKAVALDADLIITYGPSATLAAQAESPSMPTLFVDVYDPVGLQLVSADKLTGRNMTGVRGDAPLQSLLTYFLEATQVNSLAVLFDSESTEANLQKDLIYNHCTKRGVVVTPLPVVKLSDHETPLQALPADVGGIFLANSEHSESHLEYVIGFADARKIPVITQRAGAAAFGAFMVLETSATEQGEKIAEMARAVLAGKKAEEIPMYKPHRVEFVVNLQVAKRYGLNVSFQTLSVASRIVR